MGNVALTTPRVVLQDDVQLHFKAAHIREVEEIVRGWFEDNAPLGLNETGFRRTFNLQGDACKFFERFDTDSNGKVDAFEVLAAHVVLSNGTLEDKIDVVFPVFDFSSAGFLNFDEMNILINSTYRGLRKLCGTPEIDDPALVEVCRQMFDSHNLPYDQTISKEQFKRWLKNDIEATKFVDMFHNGYSLPDVEATLAQREQIQAAIFSQLCSVGSSVSVSALVGSEQLRRSLDDPPAELYEGLIRMMATGSSNFLEASLESFVEVNHAWNVFNVVDCLKEGALDPKELQVLMWLQNPPPREKPSPQVVQQQLDSLKLEAETLITKASWISMNVTGA